MAAELTGASYHQADLGDEAATRDAGRRPCSKQHGRLDVLVNNAGMSIRIPHADLKAATPALWRRMLDVNLIAPFVLVAEAEAALRKSAESGRPACIVNIGTHAGVAAQGLVDPLRRVQGGAASRHQAAGAGARARHPGQLPWRPAWSRRR